jgi:precorrin-3B synthase
VEADIRLVAVPTRSSPRLALGLAAPDAPIWTATVTAEAAPAVIRRLLAAFLKLRASGETAAMRVRHLAPVLRARLAAAAEARSPVAPATRAPAPRAGLVDLDDGRVAALIALPFGRCDAPTFATVAAWSEAFGHGELRLSPWRGVTLPGVSREAGPALLEAARSAALIVDPADPRLAVAACSGAPACANATTPTRADATRLAAAAASLIRSGATVHVSGCAKGCAQSKPAHLTLIGEGEAYRIVVGGTARDPSSVRLPIGEILYRLPDVRDATGLRQAFAEATP